MQINIFYESLILSSLVVNDWWKSCLLVETSNISCGWSPGFGTGGIAPGKPPNHLMSSNCPKKAERGINEDLLQSVSAEKMASALKTPMGFHSKYLNIVRRWLRWDALAWGRSSRRPSHRTAFSLEGCSIECREQRGYLGKIGTKCMHDIHDLLSPKSKHGNWEILFID